MTTSFELEFGAGALRLTVPCPADILALPSDPALADPAEEIRASLAHPIETPPLAEIVRAKQQAKKRLKAVIVVSDNTRPVPYQGAQGILEPLVGLLRGAKVTDIEVLIATGTHRELSRDELRAMLPASVLDGSVRITNHVCTDSAVLRNIGRTVRGTEAWINHRYLDADLKILTGLVEPHFMAGASGGPKAICPGLAGQAVTYGFHSAAMLEDPRATTLVLDGNPCHAESLAVARMAGVDFVVNVTLDGAKRLTGVFAGAMVEAHRAAVARLVRQAVIPVREAYDLIVSHAGFSGINHYQAVKAVVEGGKALRPGGTLILAANHTDVDPVGNATYRKLLPLLREQGIERFIQAILSPEWTFVPDQWEVQKWCHALRKLGAMDRLIYCSPQLTGALFQARKIPAQDGGEGILGVTGRDLAEAMVQRALDRYVRAHPGARIGVLRDGPYGVPRIVEGR